jgi:hypothetical protein
VAAEAVTSMVAAASTPMAVVGSTAAGSIKETNTKTSFIFLWLSSDQTQSQRFDDLQNFRTDLIFAVIVFLSGFISYEMGYT